ncbi:MAG: MarR family transcriptional regulator [Myxococcota bacterium]
MNPDQQFGKLLKRVYHLWHQVINERLRESDVSHSQWRVVLEVSRSASPMTQAALAAELGVESPTMVRLLDRLAEKGWIAREPCPDDRRARYVRLTPRAQRLAEELEIVVGDVRRELLQDLRVAELAASIDALEKVEQRAREAIDGSRERSSTEPAPGAGRNGAARSVDPRTPRPRSAGAKRKPRRPAAGSRPAL